MSLYSILRAADVAVNRVLSGIRNQTISANCYEQGILRGQIGWRLGYYTVNAGAYALRWLLARPFGYRWGADMPKNHCKDAYDFYKGINE